MTPAGFPHSDTPGSTLGCQLPRAYRRLLRPSSALDAKASTMCPSQLVTHTTNPTPHTKRDQNTPEETRTHQKSLARKNRTRPPGMSQGSPGTIPEPSRTHPGIICGIIWGSPGECGGQAVHTTHYKDARVHYPDLKQQPHTPTAARITRTQLEPVFPGLTARTEAPDTSPSPSSQHGTRS